MPVKGKTNGLYKHPLYSVYRGIKDRTLNQRSWAYQYYGGRGITICSGWSESFKSFLDDLGEKPAGMCLDRIDNDGHYSCGKCEHCNDNGWPMNVRWATRQQQAINRRMPNTNTTGYMGVSYSANRYSADIYSDGIDIQLGRHETAEQAAIAYDIAAIQLRGSNTKLNIL